MGASESKTISTKKKGSQNKKCVIKAVFDTSVLFTGSASDFINAAFKRAILENRDHDDAELEWYVPEVVKFEREYQMTKEANDFLGPIGKLERLIGHRLGIDEVMLATRVRETIVRQITDLGLKIISLEPTKVDWNKLVTDAAFRKPPFEKGEREKGFRDAIVAECFLQAVDSCPKNPKTCRICLVTGDGRLKDSVVPRISGRKNAKVFGTIDELQGYINTLVSKVKETFIKSVRDSAGTFFYTPDSDKGFMNTEKILDQIRNKYADNLAEYPHNANYRENGTWTVWPPSFVKKVRQRITWRTAIQVQAKALKLSSKSPAWFPAISHGPTGPNLGYEQGAVQLPSNPIFMSNDVRGSLVLGPTGPTGPYPQDFYGNVGSQYLYSSGLSIQPPNIETTKVVADGHSTFHIVWSVTITSSKKFAKAEVISIDFVETVWE